MDALDTTTLRAAGLKGSLSAAAALRQRANILHLTQKAEAAVLRPKDFGAYNHELRHALAGRICNLNGDQITADQYSGNAGTYADLIDPGNDGGNYDLEQLVNFIDKVATRPSDVTEEDIKTLQKAGVQDPDIVRLLELNSFMAYQIRLIAGLRLFKEHNS